MSKKSLLLALSLAAGALLGSLSAPSSVLASDALWAPKTGAPSSARGATASSGGSGVGLGSWVVFRGVGRVFYAGNADGLNVYFAENDQPGGYTWEKALKACQERGPGWSLPTLRQLTLLYKNRQHLDLLSKGMNASSGYWYWSSTPHNEDSAYRHRVYDGLFQPLKKHFAARVRCVRVY